MKIPYGYSNFKDIITEEYLYIDKTRYIEKLEQRGKYNILLRPRRFGKSLFLSSLHYYYDINSEHDFSALFSNLYIGSNPTPKRSSYKVLFMEFSGISGVDHDSIQNSFLFEVQQRLLSFLEKYKYSEKDLLYIQKTTNPSMAMKAFFKIIREEKIYLLIDEYDNFANVILAQSLTKFREIITSGGFVRAFYETIKTATMEGIVDRFLITGVTAITFDSMTSGFNIGDNITHNRDFSECIGFTRQETETIIQPLVDSCDLEQQQLMEVMRKWYNGYLFNEDQDERLYNCDMVLYFVKQFDIKNCCYPRQMLDRNIASDYRKIMSLFNIGDREKNYQVLEELIIGGATLGRHSQPLDIEQVFHQDDFISLLMYMGFITIGDTLLDRIRYIIPNYVIQKLYFEYFKVKLEERASITLDTDSLQEAIRELALQGDVSSLTEEIGKALALFSNRDFMRMDEKHIKAVILTLLYQSEVYFIRSEPEINNRYPDILLLERNPIKVPYQFLLELKFSKKKDGRQGWETKKAEGIKQVREYLQMESIKKISGLRSFLLLTNGSEIEAFLIE